MTTLYDKISSLAGLGPIGARALAKVGVKTVRDLLYYFPFRYEDVSQVKTISDLATGDTATIRAKIIEIAARPSHRTHVVVTEATVEDETGELVVKWFNQPFLVKTLRSGTLVSLAGTVDWRGERILVNPRYERLSDDNQETLHTGRIIPIYPRSGAVGEKRLRAAMHEALRSASKLPDWLPEEVMTSESFLSLSSALEAIHFPASMPELERAIIRLKFDELFLHQLMFATVRKDRIEHHAYSIPIDEARLRSFAAELPFTLTSSQKIAAWEVIQDLAKEHPMNRLLEGDVGSGKTVVAALAIRSVLTAGQQVTYLAPTELLARQQSVALARLCGSEMAKHIVLLTREECTRGGVPISRDALAQSLASGEPLLVVATHAVLENKWKFSALALVVVDEQHRFGVRQRHALLSKDRIAPHLLSMSATPIPRSLALTVYGDLDCSVIRELPAGRLPISTYLVPDAHVSAMEQKICEELDANHRVYIVCPLIDPSDKLGVASVAETIAHLLRGRLSKYPMAEMHGRLKADEKDKVMETFRNGTTPILVSTTVVEVGVDVPEATVMVIEGAERFGLAQLHQLRGRVGRSTRPSLCFLRPSGVLSDASKKRLEAMERCQNGFELAELDLQCRGPGNVFGDAQSGFPDFQLATIADAPLMLSARTWAQKILAADPNLEHHPLLREALFEAEDDLHLE